MKKNKPTKITLTLLIAFAVISFWRGVWGLMDIYLFPDNYTISLWLSLLLGVLILIFIRHSLKELI